ncbi:U2 small nuclear ribonucleoprotein auxiliary factor 35 kDa subunit-related protein 1 [Microplitis demolitor]|uniref:U2 small nuclear ribonucleoprotein auxiliary factor 35 kDa subunit-related protein 1 n=1 Tax=Microplitis demolitor TaxID=69319 RepID=UPI00043FFE70|nr:U2 small nuclear ribonucleoprotein auxiliary factor 35 kDa subunit-related protein 1 [Microplitis demolitor]
MENDKNVKISHKEWRKVAKKLRRKRLRRKAAQLRDFDDEQLRAALERSAEYLNWVQEQNKLREENERREKEELEEQEKQWLENEVKAQKEWQELQERKAKARAEKFKQEEIIRNEFEEKQEAAKKKREEIKRLQQEHLERQVEFEREINDYIDNGAKTPESLRLISETHPTKDPCVFFSKTGACKYGDGCSRNHQRKALTKVILIPGFYSHFSLEKNSNEYDTDIGLEYESSETRKHYREFYNDIVPELESFGRIKTLKCCVNRDIHLRGNVYVEYYTEREAARAWRKLRNRWYAGRQINCEFANIYSWRTAVCGMFNCPKGRLCNFIHAFRNPRDQYEIKSPPWWVTKAERESTSSRRDRIDFDESVRSHGDNHRNWRWSESPEMEVDSSRKETSEERRSGSKSERRSESVRSSRSDRHSKSRRESSRSSHDSSKSSRESKSRRESSKSRRKSKRHSDSDRDYKSRDDKENGDYKKNERHKRLSKDEVDSKNSDCDKVDDADKPAKVQRSEWDTTDSENSS